jgi:hypothetical protein
VMLAERLGDSGDWAKRAGVSARNVMMGKRCFTDSR